MRTINGGRGYGPSHEREHGEWRKRLYKAAQREGWGKLVGATAGQRQVMLAGDRSPTTFDLITYTFEDGTVATWHLPHPADNLDHNGH